MHVWMHICMYTWVYVYACVYTRHINTLTCLWTCTHTLSVWDCPICKARVMFSSCTQALLHAHSSIFPFAMHCFSSSFWMRGRASSCVETCWGMWEEGRLEQLLGGQALLLASWLGCVFLQEDVPHGAAFRPGTKHSEKQAPCFFYLLQVFWR